MHKLILALALLALPLTARAELRPLDMNLSDYAYPYPVQMYGFEAQGQKLEMAYMDVAATGPANGRTVVLLHGKNFSGAYWQRTIADLTAAGYRVIAPDQIGFGKSTKPEQLDYSFPGLSTWTDNLVTSLGIKNYSIIAHSMGGMLGTRMALMFPDRVEKLALVNPIGLEDWAKVGVPHKAVDEWYANELKTNADSIRNYQKNVYFDGQWKPEYESLIEIPAGWTLGADYPRIAWNSALLYEMIYTEPVVAEFKDLKMPTLLMVGTRDRTAIGKNFVTDEKVKAELGRYDLLGKAVIKTIPHGQLVEFDNVGHMPMIEVYDQYINTLKTFLTPEA